MPENMQEEPFDLYTDSFTLTITPFGANLTFSLREAHPSGNKPPQIKNLGTLRMSVEHLKAMVWVTRQQIRQVETQMGVKADVPGPVLNQLNIPPQDWADFWKPFSNI